MGDGTESCSSFNGTSPILVIITGRGILFNSLVFLFGFDICHYMWLISWTGSWAGNQLTNQDSFRRVVMKATYRKGAATRGNGMECLGSSNAFVSLTVVTQHTYYVLRVSITLVLNFYNKSTRFVVTLIQSRSVLDLCFSTRPTTAEIARRKQLIPTPFLI